MTKKLALIAHDSKKDCLIEFVSKHSFFKQHKLIATASTGWLLQKSGFEVELVPHGPKGGDIVIAAQITQNQIGGVFFFRDLEMCQPHEPDVTALLRMCDIYNVPLALNLATAELMLLGLVEEAIFRLGRPEKV